MLFSNRARSAARRCLRACRAAVLLLALVLGSGCGVRTTDPLVSPTVITARDRNTRALQRDLAVLFAEPPLNRGLVAVRVESLDNADVLFRHNDAQRVLPASNQKIVTVAASAELLGWDYRFLTRLQATGPVRDGVLEGDLIVVGTGDPTLSSRYEGAAVVFSRWAAQLRAAGIRTIAGRLVADDRAFSSEPWGAGWAWDDLENPYAAPVGALLVNDSVTDVTIRPAVAPGQPGTVMIAEPQAGLALEAHVTTAEPGGAAALTFERVPGTSILRVSGTIPAGAPPVERMVAVVNPTNHFLGTLRDALGASGILTLGGIADLAGLHPSPTPLGPPLIDHYSPRLREIAAVAMRTSHNLHAESLFGALARLDAPTATADQARQVIAAVLQRWGVPSDAVVIADGSGLSRHNHLTAAALMTILRRMATDDRHRDEWLASFARAGSEGTLSTRFSSGAAEGRVRAKTGTLTSIRALSGYVRTDGGELLAFVMIVNNAVGTREQVDGVFDRAVGRLVSFRR